MYFAKAFEETFFAYTDTIVREHQTVDTMSEETFRNIKTVASMGAEAKLTKKYGTIVGRIDIDIDIRYSHSLTLSVDG